MCKPTPRIQKKDVLRHIRCAMLDNELIDRHHIEDITEVTTIDELRQLDSYGFSQGCVVNCLQETFNIELPKNELAECTTVDDLIHLVRSKRKR